MRCSARIRNRSITVEFLGLPAAGKSSLSARVAALLDSRGVRVDQPSHRLAHHPFRPARAARKFGHVLREAMLHPRCGLRALRSIAASGQPGPVLIGKLLFNWLLVADLARRARRHRGVHLHDQGLFQQFWSIGLEAGHEAVGRVAGDLIRSVPGPGMVVVLEPSGPAVLSRLGRRGGADSRLDSIAEEDHRLLHHGSSLLETITAEVTRSGPLDGPPRCVRIRNEMPADLEDAALRLAGMIERMLGAERRTSLSGAQPAFPVTGRPSPGGASPRPDGSA